MPEIKLPFKSEFKESMLSGKKIATTRQRRYGYPGDWFEAFGKMFVLTEVCPSFLDVVIALHYLDEGFNSPQEFMECWDRLHAHATYAQRPGRSVFFHRFSPIERVKGGKNHEAEWQA